MSLGIHEGKIRKDVCFLQFLEVRIIREGGDSSKVRLFFCRGVHRTLEATLQNLHCNLLKLGVQLV